MMGFITSELKFESILQTFLEMTGSLLKAEHSGIFIFEGESKELKLFKTTIKGENAQSLTAPNNAYGASRRGNKNFIRIKDK